MPVRIALPRAHRRCLRGGRARRRRKFRWRPRDATPVASGAGATPARGVGAGESVGAIAVVATVVSPCRAIVPLVIAAADNFAGDASSERACLSWASAEVPARSLRALSPSHGVRSRQTRMVAPAPSRRPWQTSADPTDDVGSAPRGFRGFAAVRALAGPSGGPVSGAMRPRASIVQTGDAGLFLSGLGRGRRLFALAPVPGPGIPTQRGRGSPMRPPPRPGPASN